MRPGFLQFLAVSGFLAVGVAGCSGGSDPVESTTPDVSHAAVSVLALTPVQGSYEATGTVQSRSRTTVSSRIVGNIAAVNVQVGDAVKAGQTLLEIDSRDLSLQLQEAEAMVRESEAALKEVDQAILAGESARASAEASLQLASSTLARFTTLRERNAVSPHEFDEVVSRETSARAEVARATAMLEAQRARRAQILARIDQANSRVENSRVALGYARIVAPFDGLVIDKLVNPGSQAAPGVPLLELESRDYEINAIVPETAMTGMRPGMPVDVMVTAAGLDHVSGTVVSIVPAVDPATRSYTAKVRLSAGTAARLRSGMYAQVRIPTGMINVLQVPRGAVISRGQLEGVFALDASNVIRFRLVKTGESRDENVEILSGLAAGDRLILQPDSTVRDGAPWQP